MEAELDLELEDSSCSSTHSDDLQPQVMDQFVQLASALKETNENLLTFEFMLSQYRKLARIEPIVQASCLNNEQTAVAVQSEISPGLQSDYVLEQLKQLTQAVNKLQVPTSTESSKIMSESQTKELQESRETAAYLRVKVETLESEIEEKRRYCDALTEGHKRLTAQLSEEREKCLELDRKLEIEKRAAAQVGKDIKKYVERMSELEAKVQIANPKLAESERRLAETSKTCLKQEADIERLQNQLQMEERRSSELNKKFEHERSIARQMENDISNYVEKIRQLESRMRLDAEEKELLKTTMEKASYNETYHQTSVLDVTSSSVGGNALCQSCLEGDKLEEATRKVQELAAEIHKRTETDMARLTSHNETLSNRIRELETSLLKEQHQRQMAQTKVTLCEDQIRQYEDQVKDWKSELEVLQKELVRCQSQQIQQQQSTSNESSSHVDQHQERKERRKMEKELKDLRLSYADTLAVKESLTVNVSRLSHQLEETNQKLSNTEEVLTRLKSKSKILLRQYRLKRQNYVDMCGKIESIRQCLLELRDLCRTKEENFRDILDHLGSQIQISARLISAYMDVPYNYDILSLTGGVKMAPWFATIQSLSTWSHKQLMIFGSKCWSDFGSVRSREIMADCDTLSEISHTLDHDSEKEKSVLSLVDAQDRISRTQNDSFNLLISKAKASAI